MALNIEAKKVVVSELNEVAQKALCVVAAEYHGLSVAQMTDLRKQARAQGVYLKITRNTLARRAFEDTDYACMDEALIGPVILAFSIEAPGIAARLLKDFAKENEHLVVKALALNGELHGADKLSAIASLPTKEEAIAQLMSVIQAPIAKLARTMQEVPSKLVRTLAAVRDSK